MKKHWKNLKEMIEKSSKITLSLNKWLIGKAPILTVCLSFFIIETKAMKDRIWNNFNNIGAGLIFNIEKLYFESMDFYDGQEDIYSINISKFFYSSKIDFYKSYKESNISQS